MADWLKVKLFGRYVRLQFGSFRNCADDYNQGCLAGVRYPLYYHWLSSLLMRFTDFTCDTPVVRVLRESRQQTIQCQIESA